MGAIKPVAKFVAAAVMPALYLLFVVADHYDVFDKLRGLDKVQTVASRMNTSYADVKRQYRPRDPEWTPTLALIRKYTKAEMPSNRDPVLLARYTAIVSAKAEIEPGKFAEWTAPTTPLLIFYSDPPSRFNDYVAVGEIGDLFSWIEKSKADFRFMIQNVLLGIFSITLGVLIWAIEHREHKRST
jgi:hypothetical protein